MAIWKRLWGGLSGGWGSFVPQGVSDGGFNNDGSGAFEGLSPETVLRLSTVWACMNLRAEVLGTMPCHLIDGEKNAVTGHSLYSKLHTSPHAYMTAPEFFSLVNAQVDMHGNSVSVIERGYQKKVISLTPHDPTQAEIVYTKSGKRSHWKIGDDEFSDDDVLHLRGFSLNADWGASRLDIGRLILGAQLQANRSALAAFKQGLKVGGFFKVAKNLDTPELTQFQQRLEVFGRPENAGKYMTLMAGMEPIGGEPFRVKPVDAQLLESRVFGNEEICRLFNVPPPLIGQTSKASSWASSLENINLHFQIYSIAPTLVRNERSMEKKLLTPGERADGLRIKFSMQSLMRGDMKARTAFYASGLQNGWLNRNEVRDLEDRGKIEGGDKYTVQLNMTDVNDLEETDGTSQKPTPENEE